MEHNEKCDGCGYLFAESGVIDLGPPSMLVLCSQCETEYGEYLASKEKFDKECDEAMTGCGVPVHQHSPSCPFCNQNEKA